MGEWRIYGQQPSLDRAGTESSAGDTPQHETARALDISSERFRERPIMKRILSGVLTGALSRA
jgi:hypothetical protein